MSPSSRSTTGDLTRPHATHRHMPDAPRLSDPTPIAVHALVRAAFDRVVAARTEFAAAADDPEAVHALRVALTRLRAIGAEWPEALAAALGHAAAGTLGRAHRALRRVRNDDVRRTLLGDGDGAASPPDDGAATGVDDAGVNAATVAITTRLEGRRRRRLARGRRELARTLDPLLTQALAAPAVTPAVPSPDAAGGDATAGDARNGDVFARTLERAVHAAGQAVLDATSDGATPSARHRARLAFKRLRALLQPWLDAEPVLVPLMRVATAGQDAFGEERDLEQLRAFVARATRRLEGRARARRRTERRRLATDAHALRLALRERHRAMADRVAREWLAPHGPSRVALHLALAAAGAALRAQRSADAEAPTPTAPTPPAALTPRAAPSGAPVEIERKFLLRELPAQVHGLDGIRIAQGWLPGERLRERLRRSVFPDGRVEWTRTVKLGAGVTRLEIEEATDPVLFESLWPFTSAARIEKIRYCVPDGDVTWEVDRFLDRDLVLAEVELPSADTAVAPPAWLAPYIVRDVTDEAEYVNANLARVRRPVPRA